MKYIRRKIQGTKTLKVVMTVPDKIAASSLTFSESAHSQRLDKINPTVHPEVCTLPRASHSKSLVLELVELPWLRSSRTLSEDGSISCLSPSVKNFPTKLKYGGWGSTESALRWKSGHRYRRLQGNWGRNCERIW